jgi:hypothetical protein
MKDCNNNAGITKHKTSMTSITTGLEKKETEALLLDLK